jgi:transposase
VVAEAHGISGAVAAAAVGVSASTVRMLRSRWRRAGLLLDIMAATEPAIERLRAERARALAPEPTLSLSEMNMLMELLAAEAERIRGAH